VDAGQRALCIAEIRNPVAAVQTQPRRLPTSAREAQGAFLWSVNAHFVVTGGMVGDLPEKSSDHQLRIEPARAVPRVAHVHDLLSTTFSPRPSVHDLLDFAVH
jgi:hypothetical protein